MFGFSGVVSSSPEEMGVTIESTVGLIFSMMGEELLKFIPLMFFMRQSISSQKTLSCQL